MLRSQSKSRPESGEKNIDDIIPYKDITRRSIRKISVEKTPRRKILERPLKQREDIDVNTPQESPRYGKTPYRFGLWIIILISVFVLIFGLSFIFSGAKLVITPKQRTVLIDAEFNAYKTPNVNELGYEIMTIEKDGFKSVTAKGTEFVKEKSSGQITIYNNYNSSSQRLVRNTRFETPKGLIYRINKSIVVPGQKTEGGKTVPGSIEVTVYADEDGDTYNIGLTDFTIPGFSEDPRFDDFYARSKTAMIGGFIGEKKIVNESDENNARKSIQEELETQLIEDVFSQKPKGFEIYRDGIFITFTSLPNEEEDGNVIVKERAVLYGTLFEQKKFAQFIASNTVAGFDGEDVEILDPTSILFSILDKDNIQPWNDNEFLFTLSGNAHIIWSFESEQLKNDLAGKSKEALHTVLTGYPSISDAQIVLWPFWRQTLPDNIEDIKVTTIIED